MGWRLASGCLELPEGFVVAVALERAPADRSIGLDRQDDVVVRPPARPAAVVLLGHEGVVLGRDRHREGAPAAELVGIGCRSVSSDGHRERVVRELVPGTPVDPGLDGLGLDGRGRVHRHGLDLTGRLTGHRHFCLLVVAGRQAQNENERQRRQTQVFHDLSPVCGGCTPGLVGYIPPPRMRRTAYLVVLKHKLNKMQAFLV